MISAELRLKLQRRLQLQQETEDSLLRSPRGSPRDSLDLGIEVPVLAGYYKPTPREAPSLNRCSRTWTYQTSRPSLSQPEDQASSDELVLAIEELQDLIASTNMQRDEARQKQQSIEAAAVARSIELGAEVARLRINIEVLRRDLDAAQQEVRTSPSRSRRVSRASQQEAEQDSLAAEVSRTCNERAILADKVRSLEEEVAGSVVERARLEGLLRHCLLRESEAQRRLQALENAAGNKDSIGEVFALDLDDLDDADESEITKDLGDLELCYEDGLELSRIMPMHQALRLARGQHAHAGKELSPRLSPRLAPKDSNQPARASSSSAPSVPPYEDDSDYFDAPLKSLELALSRLRGGEDAHVTIKDEALTPRYEAKEAVEVSPEEKARARLKSDVSKELLRSTQSPRKEYKELVKIPEPIGILLLSPYAALGRRFTRIAR